MVLHDTVELGAETGGTAGRLTQKKYDNVLTIAYMGTMKSMRTMSKIIRREVGPVGNGTTWTHGVARVSEPRVSQVFVRNVR